jgi:hypothetical protein
LEGLLMARSWLLITVGVLLIIYQFQRPSCCLVVLGLAAAVAVAVVSLLEPDPARGSWRRSWLGSVAWAQFGAVVGGTFITSGPAVCEVPVLGATAGALLTALGRLIVIGFSR